MFLALLLVIAQAPAPCQWQAPVSAGVLADAIDEASGLALSRRFPDRAYLVNDSGDGGRLFVTGAAGGPAQSPRIRGFQPRDVEALAIGRCAAESDDDCIFIGDIGDNDAERDTIEIVVVLEHEQFSADIEPMYRVRARYPDGAHDAEAMATHPDGSLYILTKGIGSGAANTVRLYRLDAEHLRPGNEVRTLEPAGAIDMRRVLPNTLPFGRWVTAMDIAPDGRRFIVITYLDAVEFQVDLSAGLEPDGWTADVDYRVIRLDYLEQQEAVAYEADGRAFRYTTERPVRSRPARIMRVSCQ